MASDSTIIRPRSSNDLSLTLASANVIAAVDAPVLRSACAAERRVFENS